jgi:flagellar biogenesis protein FliO
MEGAPNVKRIAVQCRMGGRPACRQASRLLVAMAIAVLLCASAVAAEDSAAGAPRGATAGSSAGTTPDSAATRAAAPAASFMDAPEGAEATGSAVPRVGLTLARLVGALVLIGALLLGALILLKRFAGRTLKLARGGPEKPLRIVERVSLGAKTHICLLNACGRYLVVGVTEKEINVLMEVTLPGDESAPKDFAALLAGVEPQKRSGA